MTRTSNNTVWYVQRMYRVQYSSRAGPFFKSKRFHDLLPHACSDDCSLHATYDVLKSASARIESSWSDHRWQSEHALGRYELRRAAAAPSPPRRPCSTLCASPLWISVQSENFCSLQVAKPFLIAVGNGPCDAHDTTRSPTRSSPCLHSRIGVSRQTPRRTRSS